jgi:thiol-disulfide isomerase/thioredoxin
MPSPPLLSILLASLLLPVLAFYDPSGPVTLLNPESFDQKVRNSKHATIVEFFAPWSTPQNATFGRY